MLADYCIIFFFATGPEASCLDNYPIHTITGLVKRWLRELPDPLMTFDLYKDFLHAVGKFVSVKLLGSRRSPV